MGKHSAVLRVDKNEDISKLDGIPVYGRNKNFVT
jgi:hypothetical protein